MIHSFIPRALLILTATGLVAGCGHDSIPGCDHDPAATSIGGATAAAAIEEIAPAAVAALIAEHPEVVIVDVNPREIYDDGHVPGARWASYRDLSGLPRDKHTSLIFYCYNPVCSASHQAATAAIAQGWTDVRRMPAGIVGWKSAGLPVER